jgi:hypothetical protein
MNYIQKAKDYASMVAYSKKGDEYTFDQIGLEYFLDSIGLPKAEWVGLTKEEIVRIASLNQYNDIVFAFAIEAKLKEKNGY